MKATIERATLLKSLSHVQSVVERRNTIPILSNVLIEAREDGSIRLMATDLDLQVDESIQANVATPGATTVSAHTLFDIVRKLPDGSQVELNAAEGKMHLTAGRSRFNLLDAPARRLPGDCGRRTADPLRASCCDAPPDHRQDALRHLVRRDPLLSDGHLPARRRRRAEGRGDRRASPRPGHGRQARRRRRNAGRDRPAEMRGRAPQAARGARRHGRSLDVADQDPLRPRQRGADQQADRRHVPRLQPGHSDRERQAPEARSEELRAGRRPRLDHCQREDPRGEDERRPRQGDLVGDLARERHRDRGTRRATMAPTRSRSASTLATCSTSSARSMATRSRSTSPTPRLRRCCARTTRARRSTSSCRCGCDGLPSLAGVDHPGQGGDL